MNIEYTWDDCKAIAKAATNQGRSESGDLEFTITPIMVSTVLYQYRQHLKSEISKQIHQLQTEIARLHYELFRLQQETGQANFQFDPETGETKPL